MKFLALFAVLAVAVAEPDSQFLGYNNYFGYPTTGYAGYGYVPSVVNPVYASQYVVPKAVVPDVDAKKVEEEKTVYTVPTVRTGYGHFGYGLPQYGYGYGLPHYIAKRDTEDVVKKVTPDVYATTPVQGVFPYNFYQPYYNTYAGGYGYVPQTATYTVPTVNPGYSYFGYGLPHYIAKRDTEDVVKKVTPDVYATTPVQGVFPYNFYNPYYSTYAGGYSYVPHATYTVPTVHTGYSHFGYGLPVY